MPSLRILSVTVRADIGGGPEHLYRLSQAFGEKARITVACPDEPPYHARYAALSNVEAVIDIPHRKFSVSRFWQLVSLVRQRDFDIIHSHGKGAGLYTRLLSLITRRPCVHTFHGLHVGEYGKVKRMIYLGIERFLGMSTRTAICVSQGEYDLICAARILPSRKMRIVENGVIVAEALRVPPQNDRLEIVAVSRFDHQKNPEMLVEIAALLKQQIGSAFRLTVLGQGEKMDAIAEQIATRGLTNEMVLHGPHPSPVDVMAQADIFLSTSRWEGMPLAVLEAMGQGVCPVVSDVVGNNDVVQGGETGRLFGPDDPQTAADICAEMNGEMRAQLGAQAYARAKARYSVARMADETLAIYDDAITGEQH